MSDLEQFVNDFDIVTNALDMRTLLRWNGRNIKNKENLAEHTHLVVACAIKLYDQFQKLKYDLGEKLVLENVIKRCMLHDSLELLRGDILSITKDSIPGLREATDKEEAYFMSHFTYTDSITDDFVKLADLMACYKFIERELANPSSDYIQDTYCSTKKKFDMAFRKFVEDYDIPIVFVENTVDERFRKGYEDDAGIDVVLNEKVVFMPMRTQIVDLDVKFTPKEKMMGILCSRTSAASKGLIVATCPIDANYCGTIKAIVHNVSNQILTYNKGDAFCQIVCMPIVVIKDGVKIKREGKRTDGSLGSTDANTN